MNGSTKEPVSESGDKAEVGIGQPPPDETTYPEFMTTSRMNRILMAVMRGEDKEAFGLINEEERAFWDGCVDDYVKAKAGGYGLEIPYDWAD